MKEKEIKINYMMILSLEKWKHKTFTKQHQRHLILQNINKEII